MESNRGRGKRVARRGKFVYYSVCRVARKNKDHMNSQVLQGPRGTSLTGPGHHRDAGARKNREGFTLIELIIALGVIAVVFAGVLGVVAQSFTMVTSSDDRVTAIKVAQTQIVALREVARDVGLAQVLLSFPPGAAIAPPPAVLNGEAILFQYVNVAGDPLLVTVTVTYTANNGRQLSESLATAISAT